MNDLNLDQLLNDNRNNELEDEQKKIVQELDTISRDMNEGNQAIIEHLKLISARTEEILAKMDRILSILKVSNNQIVSNNNGCNNINNNSSNSINELNLNSLNYDLINT
jgi:hypothetical protein